MANIRDEVLQLRESYMRCQDAADAEGCVRHWDSDGILLPPNERSVRGTDELLSWYKAAFDEISIDFEVSYSEIQVAGDWSFATGTHSGRVIPRSGGEPVEDAGKLLEVHRRQSDGSLKFYAHMWSSDKPSH